MKSSRNQPTRRGRARSCPITIPLAATHHRLRTVLMVSAVAVVVASLAPAASLAATQEDKTQFSVIAGSLSFSTVPALPTLSSVTLNGAAQTTNSTMTNFGAADATGSGSGWNIAVEGQAGAGKSAVFAQYCPKAKCGAESEGYIGGGATLAANSLTLNSTAASFAAQGGSTGAAATLQCAVACNVDHASAVKIASAALNAGMGTWLTSGLSATSLALATPSTLKVLPSEQVYRVNLLWTLSTGP
jgi:FlaG/FlaF family flagellin (archaellin)